LTSGLAARATWGLRIEDVARISSTARAQHLWAGPDALARLGGALRTRAAELPEEQRAWWQQSAAGLEQAFADLRALLERPDGPLAAHARALDAALFGARPFVMPSAR